MRLAKRVCLATTVDVVDSVASCAPIGVGGVSPVAAAARDARPFISRLGSCIAVSAYRLFSQRNGTSVHRRCQYAHDVCTRHVLFTARCSSESRQQVFQAHSCRVRGHDQQKACAPGSGVRILFRERGRRLGQRLCPYTSCPQLRDELDALPQHATASASGNQHIQRGNR